MPQKNLCTHTSWREWHFLKETEKCLLCCSEIPKQYYYECLTCHDDILIFLKIMHEPKFWIPFGWGEFASHPIRVTAKRAGDQFDAVHQCFFINYNAVGDEDSTHYFLAKKFQHCENNRHIPSLQILCIRYISLFLKAPCPSLGDLLEFMKIFKKLPLPNKMSQIVENLFEDIFECSPFDFCAPTPQTQKIVNFSRTTVFSDPECVTIEKCTATHMT